MLHLETLTRPPLLYPLYPLPMITAQAAVTGGVWCSWSQPRRDCRSLLSNQEQQMYRGTYRILNCALWNAWCHDQRVLFHPYPSQYWFLPIFTLVVSLAYYYPNAKQYQDMWNWLATNYGKAHQSTHHVCALMCFAVVVCLYNVQDVLYKYLVLSLFHSAMLCSAIIVESHEATYNMHNFMMH